MANPYIGEIRIFAGTFAPAGWNLCDGSILPISGNDALFNLLGTTYGGDGVSNFGLPNLLSRVPMGTGQSAGTSNYTLGASSGAESVTLIASQLPVHSHPVACSTAAGDSSTPANNFFAANGNVSQPQFAAAPNQSMNPGGITSTGNSVAHENRMPYQAILFIIATQGIYPTQN